MLQLVDQKTFPLSEDFHVHEVTFEEEKDFWIEEIPIKIKKASNNRPQCTHGFFSSCYITKIKKTIT